MKRPLSVLAASGALTAAALVSSVCAGAVPTVAAEPASSDDRGFVGSRARCEESQTAAAIGRTKRSLVVICTCPGGQHEYRGVRLSDQAALVVSAQPDDGGFVAENDGVTYVVSEKALAIKSARTLREEPMIEYWAPSAPLETSAPPETSAQPETSASRSPRLLPAEVASS